MFGGKGGFPGGKGGVFTGVMPFGMSHRGGGMGGGKGGKGSMGMMGGMPPPMMHGPLMASGARRTAGNASNASSGRNDAVKFDKKLGSGAFAECYVATYQGTEVAAKTTSCPTGFPEKEIALLKRAQGKGVVKLLGIEEGTQYGQAILMELAAKNLQDDLKQQREEGVPAEEGSFLL